MEKFFFKMFGGKFANGKELWFDKKEKRISKQKGRGKRRREEQHLKSGWIPAKRRQRNGGHTPCKAKDKEEKTKLCIVDLVVVLEDMAEWEVGGE